MQKYEMVLKNEKTKLYNRFALFIFVLNAIAIIYFLYSGYGKIKQSNNGFMALLLLINALLIYLIASFKKKKQLAFLSLVIGISMYWILIGYWWISLIMVMLSYLYSQSKRKLKVSFADQIIYPSFPTRIIQWNELNNVILKDGLLTIDFKNNKIIQQLIKHSNAIYEKEFNEFCKQQLKAAASI
jgi:CDP-diglyceride synthetase